MSAFPKTLTMREFILRPGNEGMALLMNHQTGEFEDPNKIANSPADIRTVWRRHSTAQPEEPLTEAQLFDAYGVDIREVNRG